MIAGAHSSMKNDADVQDAAGMTNAALRGGLPAMDAGRKALENSIHDLERRLRSLQEVVKIYADEYDFAPVGSVTLAAKGHIHAINITGARMLGGKDRSSLIGRPFLVYVAKSDFKKFLDHLRRCQTTGKQVVTELRLSANGISTEVQLLSVPVLDAERQETVYRTAMIDITERVLAQKALEENEKRYRGLVDLSPDAIWVHCDGRLVLVNPAAVALFGAETQEEILGRSILDFVHPDFKAPMAERLEKIRGGNLNPPRREERRMIFKNAAVDMELSATSLVFEGKNAVMVIARDVSLRKRLEQEILNISEREQSRVGQDLHDGLCQELAGIAFLAEALKHNLAAGKLSPAAASADAGTIAAYIKDAIDEAHGLATGMFPVRIEENGLMSALEELAADTARRFHIACKFKCAEPVALTDNHAATHLYRIVQEAVNNAVKHGRAKSVVIRLDEAGGRIILKIQDNGDGVLKKIKHPGMGLKTMNYRAQTIGGALEIRQRPRRGLEITCSFPQQQKPEA